VHHALDPPEANAAMSILAARPAAAPPVPEPEGERSVVGWSGTGTARAALAWAAAREHRRGGALVLVRVLEDSGGFRPRADVQRALDELDAELAALRKAFPGLSVTADLCPGSAEEVLPTVASGPALLVTGARGIRGDAVRSPWSLSMRLVSAGRASVVIVPTDCWSWRTGVVTAWRGPEDGAAVLFAAEEAQARGMRLTLVATEEHGRDIGEEAELVRDAFPGLELEVLRAAPGPVLVGLARSAALVVIGADAPGDPEPLSVTLAAASEAPVAVIRAPRIRTTGGAPARALRARF
jgi:hypothetical protein